jgi:hypothetical protein
VELLAFEQVGRTNEHWRLQHGGHAYEIQRVGRTLTLAVDGGARIENGTLAIAGRWSDAQTNALLTVMMNVIKNKADFQMLLFPAVAVIEQLPAHRLGPLPRYVSAEVIEDFGGDWLLQARDHARWYAIYERMMKGFSRTSSFKAVKDPTL